MSIHQNDHQNVAFGNVLDKGRNLAKEAGKTLVRQKKEISVVPGLPLNVSHMILGWILSMLLSDFKTRGLRSIPTLPMTGFFSEDAETNS